MRKGVIYVCVNMFDGRRYIGQTTQSFEIRKKKHLQDVSNNSQLYFHQDQLNQRYCN